MRKSFFKNMLVMGFALAAIAVPALGQSDSDQQIIIYKGSAVNDSIAGKDVTSGVIVGGWGAGTCKQVDTPAYGDVNGCLKITTESYYEGARFDFPTPVDLSSCLKTPFCYLRFAVQFRSSSSSTGLGGTTTPRGGGMPGMMGGPGIPGGMAMPGAMPGGMPGMAGGGIGMAGGMDTTESAVPPMAPVIRNVRVVLYLDNGDTLATGPQMVDISKTGIRGWAWISIPFAAFKASKGGKIPETIRVKRMTLAGDNHDTFYLGEIRTEIDTDPITASAGDDQVVAVNDNVVFQGFGDSKITPLKYTWDFDSSDGIQEEAVGPIVTHAFKKGGVYTVTLTVSDPMGFKKPATSTCTVEVND